MTAVIEQVRDFEELVAQTIGDVDLAAEGQVEASEAAVALREHLGAARGPFRALGCAAPVLRTVGWARAALLEAAGLDASWGEGWSEMADGCDRAFEAAVAALDAGATGLSVGSALSDVEVAVTLREAMTTASLLYEVLGGGATVEDDGAELEGAHAALEAVEPGWQGGESLEFMSGVGWKNATGLQAARRASAEAWREVLDVVGE